VSAANVSRNDGKRLKSFRFLHYGVCLQRSLTTVARNCTVYPRRC